MTERDVAPAFGDSEAGTLPAGVECSTLPSGARVVTEHIPAVRSATVGFWIGTGSRHERANVAGASHFLEHLLFKGTRRRSARDIAEALEAVGGEMNAFTAKEYTCFYARCLGRDLPLAIDVLGDMMTSARIRSADVDAERDVVLEEIRMHLDTPDDLVHSVFSAAVLDGHPLGREVLGDEATITSMRRDQVHRWYRRQYVPNNVVVAIAGDVEHARAVELVAQALDGWEGAAPSTPTARRPAASAERLVVRPRPTEQTHLVLGGLGLARGDERRHAAHVLDQALGGGMASRLFQEIRERRGLAYSVFSYLSLHAEGGVFGIYAGTAPERAATVLDVLSDELARATDQGFGDAELARARGALTGALVLSLEDTASRMSRLGKSLITGTPLLELDELIARIDAVTVADVAEVASELLQGPRTLAVVGPVEEGGLDGLESHAVLAA